MVKLNTLYPCKIHLLKDILAVLLISSIFSSALLYNRAEAGILLFGIIGAVLSYNMPAFRQDKNGQIILVLQLIFAVSVLLTGYEILGRSLVGSSHTIEFFGSLTGFSLLGFFSYHFWKKTNGTRFVFPIFSILCVILLIYSMTYGGRVYDLTGRYVITLGLPLCIFSLTFLGLLKPEARLHVNGAIFFNTTTLFVVTLGIASRTQTIALLISWVCAAVVLKHPMRAKLAYFLIPALFCGAYFIANSQNFDGLVSKRFSSLYEMVFATTQIANISPDDSPTSDSSINTRLSLLKLGIDTSRENFFFGAGNLAEGQFIKEHVGNYANFHNQFLSFIVQGGIVHLIAGICYIIAPLIVTLGSADQIHRKAIILPSLFLVSLLPFTSYHNLGGMAHLHILFSWLIFALASEQD